MWHSRRSGISSLFCHKCCCSNPTTFVSIFLQERHSITVCYPFPQAFETRTLQLFGYIKMYFVHFPWYHEQQMPLSSRIDLKLQLVSSSSICYVLRSNLHTQCKMQNYDKRSPKAGNFVLRQNEQPFSYCIKHHQRWKGFMLSYVISPNAFVTVPIAINSVKL